MLRETEAVGVPLALGLAVAVRVPECADCEACAVRVAVLETVWLPVGVPLADMVRDAVVDADGVGLGRVTVEPVGVKVEVQEGVAVEVWWSEQEALRESEGDKDRDNERRVGVRLAVVRVADGVAERESVGTSERDCVGENDRTTVGVRDGDAVAEREAEAPGDAEALRVRDAVRDREGLRETERNGVADAVVETVRVEVGDADAVPEGVGLSDAVPVKLREAVALRRADREGVGDAVPDPEPLRDGGAVRDAVPLRGDAVTVRVWLCDAEAEGVPEGAVGVGTWDAVVVHVSEAVAVQMADPEALALGEGLGVTELRVPVREAERVDREQEPVMEGLRIQLGETVSEAEPAEAVRTRDTDAVHENVAVPLAVAV